MKLDPYIRVRVGQLRGDRHDVGGEQRRVGGDPDRPRDRAAAAELQACLLDVGKDAPGPGHEVAPCRGQSQPPSVPLEQWDANIALQSGELPRNRGRGVSGGCRGRADGPPVGEGDQDTQPVQIHRCSLFIFSGQSVNK